MAEIKLFAMQTLLTARWYSDDDPELSPLKGAMVLSAGWQEFRADCIRDLQCLERTCPGLFGREDWTPVVRAVWRKLKRRLRAWTITACGRPRTPREVIRLFDLYYRRPEPVTLETTKWTLTDSDALTGVDGTRRGWKTSGVERTGTLPELLQDMQEGVPKDEAANQIDEEIERNKRGVFAR